MESGTEKKFSKYELRGSYHWKEMLSRDVRVFNAYHQAHYEWVLKIAGDLTGKKVLDIGCGDGVLVYLLAKAGAVVTGVDNEEHGLRFAEENLKARNEKGDLSYAFVNTSAYTLPFEANSFDLVVSSEVIEHVQEPERMVREATRVLKVGGKLILTTPYRVTEKPQDPNHVKEYFPSELEALLSPSLTDITVKSTHHMLWYSLYTYPGFTKRPYGKWFINALALYAGWNPFMIDFKKPAKLEFFSTLCAWGYKR